MTRGYRDFDQKYILYSQWNNTESFFFHENINLCKNKKQSLFSLLIMILITGSGKTSVMERVTNVFCGGGGGGGGVAYMSIQNAIASQTPEKPSRSSPMSIQNQVNVANSKGVSNSSTVVRTKISRGKLRIKNVPLASYGTPDYISPSSWEQLMLDENFLSSFFLYFNVSERRILAQVQFLLKNVYKTLSNLLNN